MKIFPITVNHNIPLSEIWFMNKDGTCIHKITDIQQEPTAPYNVRYSFIGKDSKSYHVYIPQVLMDRIHDLEIQHNKDREVFLELASVTEQRDKLKDRIEKFLESIKGLG